MTSDINASKILSNPFQMLSFCLIEKSNCLIVATNAKVGLFSPHVRWLELTSVSCEYDD